MNGFNLSRFMAVIKKEFIQVKRDPISLRIAIFMPLMMMMIFGYAVNTEVDNIPTVVFDHSKTQLSREYIQKFANSGYFMIKYYVEDEGELQRLLDTGSAKAGIIIPIDFSEKIKQNKTVDTQLIVDGTEPTTARTAFNSGILISNNFSMDLQGMTAKKMGINASTANIRLNAKAWNNPNLETQKFTIPGLLGIIMQNITVMLTAFAFVREKEKGTIEQLMVTPVKSAELILAKMIPFIFIGYLGFLISLFVAVFWFKISVTGSVFLLLLMGGLFVIASLSMGMLISTFAQNQMQAMLGAMAVLLPSVLLSGFMFPREAMPIAIGFISYLLPISYFINILRGIVLKGIGVNLLMPDILPLIGITVLLLVFASLRVRKSMD